VLDQKGNHKATDAACEDTSAPQIRRWSWIKIETNQPAPQQMFQISLVPSAAGTKVDREVVGDLVDAAKFVVSVQTNLSRSTIKTCGFWAVLSLRAGRLCPAELREIAPNINDSSP
jgi:hypothetical protein